MLKSSNKVYRIIKENEICIFSVIFLSTPKNTLLFVLWWFLWGRFALFSMTPEMQIRRTLLFYGAFCGGVKMTLKMQICHLRLHEHCKVYLGGDYGGVRFSHTFKSAFLDTLYKVAPFIKKKHLTPILYCCTKSNRSSTNNLYGDTI